MDVRPADTKIRCRYHHETGFLYRIIDTDKMHPLGPIKRLEAYCLGEIHQMDFVPVGDSYDMSIQHALQALNSEIYLLPGIN